MRKLLSEKRAGSPESPTKGPFYWIEKLILPITLAMLGLLGQCTFNSWSNRQATENMYSQLLSSREAKEVELRKEMFAKILDSFRSKDQSSRLSMDEKVLNLELLVYNFNESLNLSPLISSIREEAFALQKSDPSASSRLVSRIEGLAREVASKQLLLLKSRGIELSGEFSIEVSNDKLSVKETAETPDQIHDQRISKCHSSESCILRTSVQFCPPENSSRIGSAGLFVQQVVEVSVKEIDAINKRLKISVALDPVDNEGASNPPPFWLEYFDFPMIDNIRLEQGYRLGIILDQFSPAFNGKTNNVSLRLVVFPEELSGLRDKAQIDELLHRVQEGTSVFEDRPTSLSLFTDNLWPSFMTRLRLTRSSASDLVDQECSAKRVAFVKPVL